METRKPEYQHFIPQFLLRNFSHKYAKAKAGKPQKRGKKNKMYPGDPVINSLCLSDDEYHIDECLVKRVCGVENMYVDAAKPATEQGNLEKKFAVLENRASCVYRKITRAYEDGKSAVWLKRTEKDILRKFIFLLTYRGEQYHRRYNFDSMQEYAEDDKDLLQAYMTKHGFTRPIDVWLQSLETIVDLDMDAQGRWRKSIFKSIYFPIADTFVDHIGEMYMAICTPENPDEEFILTDNCYNVTEGHTTSYYDESSGRQVIMSPRFHKFAPVSPRLMLVLRHNLLPEPNEDANPEVREYREFHRQLMIDSLYGSGTKSILEDLPVRKATNSYTHLADGRLMPNAGWNQRFGAHDEFCFAIFKIPTQHVRKMNGLLIDHAFHGSRIVFNRKDVFLDLMGWYLTEPCEVGKNIMGEHAAIQMLYIEGLSDFMLREGRELEPEWTFWPSEHRDLEQLRIQNVAGARFLEEARRGDNMNDAGLGFDAIYDKLGGTNEAFEEDVMMAKTMVEIWARCVDLDWGTPEYEHVRSRKLDWLMDGYQRQSCPRLWLFFKRMRVCQSLSELLSGTFDMPSFERGDGKGPEDMLAYAHPVVQGHELNVAMYKAFNESMQMSRGPGRGLESMGYFSLFGDLRWRIPTPAAGVCWPWNDEGINDEPEVNQTSLSLLLNDLDGKARNDPPQRKQQFDDTGAERDDMAGLKKAAQSWLFQDEKGTEVLARAVEELQPEDEDETREVPDTLQKAARSRLFHDQGTEDLTEAIEELRKAAEELEPDNDEVRETSDALSKATHAWLPGTQDDETRTSKAKQVQPDDHDTGAQEIPDANIIKVHPEPLQNEPQRKPQPRHSNLLRKLEADRILDTHTRYGMVGAVVAFLLLASLNLFLLGSVSYVLSRLFYSTAWVLRGLAWLLDGCWPALFVVAKYSLLFGIGLGYGFWGFLRGEGVV